MYMDDLNVHNQNSKDKHSLLWIWLKSNLYLGYHILPITDRVQVNFVWTLYLHIASWFRPIRYRILNAVQYFLQWRNRLAYFQSHKSNDQ